MINKKNGHIKINQQLVITPEYTFEEFKETKFYTGEDGIRIIYLKEPQLIDGRNYIIGLFFTKGKIYSVSFVCCDYEISELDEAKRKVIHDAILKQYDIDERKQYDWGKVISEYDVRGNISSINVYFSN